MGIMLIGLALCARADESPQWSFVEAARLPGATSSHAATVLDQGEILVTGGYGELLGMPLAVNMMRIYDPAANAWRGGKGQLQVGRLAHGAIRLHDGRVLLVGGIGQDKKPLRSVEMYDPATEQVKTVGQMAAGRSFPQLNLLPEHRVLITGEGKPAEILEYQADSVSIRKTRGSTKLRRDAHSTLDLPDGYVLLIGGLTKTFERFNPKDETFHACKAALPLLLDDMGVALLFNGKVLIAGGQDRATGKCINRTWLYDPQCDMLTEGPTLSPSAEGKVQPGVADLAVADLGAGQPKREGRYILLAGGEYDPGGKHTAQVKDIVLDSAWVYDAEKNLFIEVGPLPHPHDDFAAVTLPATETHYRAILIGGYSANDTHLGWCDIVLWRR